jgi:hypothetical protein
MFRAWPGGVLDRHPARGWKAPRQAAFMPKLPRPRRVTVLPDDLQAPVPVRVPIQSGSAVDQHVSGETEMMHRRCDNRHGLRK